MAEEHLYKASLSKAMALCSRREYCPEDIRLKLQSWGVSEADACRVIGILIKENFLNENRYAEAFVKDKFNYNKWGKVKITANLKLKKLPAGIIRSALGCIDDDIYRKTLSDLIVSHRRRIKAKNQYDLKGKLLRYGLSKGFESSLLYELLNEM
ncbi:MAG TPA: regulatory protein RecX [Bacteroidales bacterium]|nr:regulatory protein RecX [Bacteroidales bacterium]